MNIQVVWLSQVNRCIFEELLNWCSKSNVYQLRAISYIFVKGNTDGKDWRDNTSNSTHKNCSCWYSDANKIILLNCKNKKKREIEGNICYRFN